ncbi:MAG: hypothetical protein MPK62_01335 [Alphaproteobacteria bacterium]|nr:hypothetical protein [Alphaproteobacteria bacterium]MDA8029778.1 hypothetical protein [Alphaproteobacteria bacterium]
MGRTLSNDEMDDIKKAASYLYRRACRTASSAVDGWGFDMMLLAIYRRLEGRPDNCDVHEHEIIDLEDHRRPVINKKDLCTKCGQYVRTRPTHAEQMERLKRLHDTNVDDIMKGNRKGFEKWKEAEKKAGAGDDDT